MTPGFSGVLRPHDRPHTIADAQNTALPTINVAAFTNPANGTYGNAARTAAYGLFAPHIADIDASVRKEVPIHESIKFALQGDVFNLPNRVYFAAPTTGTGSANFGLYANQANQPRKWQFSARVTF